MFHVRQRVRVDCPPDDARLGRILEVQPQIDGSRVVQRLRIAFDDGMITWHTDNDEASISPVDDDDGDCWQRLEMRCQLSRARLTDPASGPRCLHPPCCNYDALVSFARTKLLEQLHLKVRQHCCLLLLLLLPRRPPS